MSIFNNLPGFRDRFWYWNGQSGKKYIHSIYALSDCPPLPGAVYITVQKTADGGRKALEVGRFGDNWDYVDALIEDQRCGLVSIDEIHVHLLAQSDENADDVLSDLEGAIGHCSAFTGFHEDKVVPITPPSQATQTASVNVKSWQAEMFDIQSCDRALGSA